MNIVTESKLSGQPIVDKQHKRPVRPVRWFFIVGTLLAVLVAGLAFFKFVFLPNLFKEIFGKNGEVMPVSEWVTSLSENAPHLFAKSQGGNSPKENQSGNGTGGKKTMTRTVFDALEGHLKAGAVKEYTLID